jgi:L-aspartate oxidase
MQNMGIIREGSKMETALRRIEEISGQFKGYRSDYNLFKINNIAKICTLMSRAAILRKESRGGHIREDFREEEEKFRMHIVQQKGQVPEFVPIRDKV